MAGGSGNVASGGPVAIAAGSISSGIRGCDNTVNGFGACAPRERDTKDVYIDKMSMRDKVRLWDDMGDSRTGNIVDLIFLYIVKGINNRVMSIGVSVLAVYVCLFILAVMLSLIISSSRHFFPQQRAIVRLRKNVPRKVLDTPAEAMSSDRMTCVVCMVNTKNVMFEPCGHIASCETCSLQLQRQKCPMCRKPFTKIKRTFF